MLLPAQREFILASDPYPALVAGFGSGKTAAGIARALAKKIQWKENDVAYYLPTFPLIEDIAFERFPELLERKGWDYKLNKSGGNPEIMFPGAGKIKFRSMEKPERIVGYEVGDSIVDELDTLPIKKARTVWQKIIARNRQKRRRQGKILLPGDPGWISNSVGVVTTPEGFRFVWEQWQKKRPKGYKLIHAKTMDNAANLPPDYIDNLIASYPANLIEAYLEGKFVNLTQGTVYTCFDRDLLKSEVTIDRDDKEPIHIGMDFNVGKMAAILHVLRNGKPHAADEIVNVLDTREMIKKIDRKYKDHPILVYPDASGGNRKSSNASESDIALLREAKYNVCVNPRNPAVKDRVISMQKAFENKLYRVNPDTCPNYVEALERQTYDDNGEPDKKSDFDHPNDAGGYFIAYKWPVVKQSFNLETLRA